MLPRLHSSVKYLREGIEETSFPRAQNPCGWFEPREISVIYLLKTIALSALRLVQCLHRVTWGSTFSWRYTPRKCHCATNFTLGLGRDFWFTRGTQRGCKSSVPPLNIKSFTLCPPHCIWLMCFVERSERQPCLERLSQEHTTEPKSFHYGMNSIRIIILGEDSRYELLCRF